MGISRDEINSTNFRKVIDIVLPPKRGVKAVITSGWGGRNAGANASRFHEGIDFVYPHGVVAPKRDIVHSPVSGVVRFSAAWNGVYITDAKGYEHCFIHNHKALVKSGSVSAGQPIGILGGFGQYKDDYRGEGKDHVHYWVFDPRKKKISPVDYWNGTRQTFVNLPRQENGLPVENDELSDSITSRDIGESETEYHNQHTEASDSTVSSYRPRMAAVSPLSEASVALLPNRVPMHEPWPRNMLVNTPFVNGETDEVEYNTRMNPQHNPDTDDGAKLIGKIEGHATIDRGVFWRR